MGSSWFSSEAGKKGAIVAGQLADLAVLSADYFTIPDDDIKRLESALTIVGGHVVHGSEEFDALAPRLPPPAPDWSPVQRFGGSAGAAGASDRRKSSALAAPAGDRAWGLACGCWAF